MPPIHLLNELRYLVPSEFESKLLRSGIYSSDDGWSDRARGSGLMFDLSRLEWVDIGSLVQLVLLTESALMAGLRVSVALPIPTERFSEQQWIESEVVAGAAQVIGAQIERRRKVLAFLDYLGFAAALKPKHLGAVVENITILPNYDPERKSARVQSHDESVERPTSGADSDKERLYEFFFPLTWLSEGDAPNTRKMLKFLAGVVGQPKRGLEAIDANAISNVILYELIDNVSRHAGGSGHALVAAWARRDNWVYDKDHYIDCEQPFIEWLSQRQSSSVEIVVGDSGRGIPKVLKKSFEASSASRRQGTKTGKNKTAQILQWSLDRWSTSRPTKRLRGTRGLYRVDRVVSKYQGMVTLRAESSMVARDHGGPSYDQAVVANQMLSTIPGTIMRCRMPSFHEDSTPRIAIGRVPRVVTFDQVNLGVIGPEGIEKPLIEKLRDRLAGGDVDEPVCVLAIVEGATSPSLAVETALRQCVETRHPGTLVIFGLPGGWDLLEGAIDSINSEHEKQSRGIESASAKHFRIWDPVLVIGPQGQFGWVGTDRPAKLVLEHLLSSANGVMSNEALRTLIPNGKVRAAILKYFRSDTNLIRFQIESLELLVTGSEIAAYVLRLVNTYLTKPGERDGILTGKVFRTPSLLLVNRWLDVKKIVERSCGVELLMFALSQQVIKSRAWSSVGPANTILADSTVAATHLEKMREYLGTDVDQQTIPGETGAPVLPGSRVLPDGARVIVYCDVMAASEAVGRCLRQVRREGAQAIAIACVVDARETQGSELTLLDMKVPVISLTSLDMVVPETTTMSISNINPITRKIEETIDRHLTYEISRGALDELIRENKALHFSHVGRPIGRHFTFYLNALPFDSPLISETFDKLIDRVINAWNDSIGRSESPKLEVWHPAPEPKPSEPARRFAEMIKNRRKDVALIRTISRESAYGRWVFTGTQDSSVSHPTVVIVDWGALTGTTVMQMVRLAAEAGARRILVCVFLSQIDSDEESFLRSIRMLQVRTKARQFETFKSLPFEGSELIEIFPQVVVTFLSGFPIEAYSRYECPVCQQLDRLSQENYPNALLKNFAIHQEETRLRLRDRKELQDAEPRDFDNNSIDSESLLWMVDFRGTLVEALTSTASRYAVGNRIRSMFQNAKASQLPSPEILRFLRFLSVESQWLRKPPLYFSDLRDTIAEMALLVALNPAIPEGDRLNATIVLRTSNKALFAKRFSSLFRALSVSDSLLRQLLYDAFTYLTRPYHQTATVFEPLRDGLKDVQAGIDDRSLQLLGNDAGEISATVEILLMRAQTELATAGARQDTPVQSWSHLRHIFSAENYHPHDSVPKAANWILPGLDAEIIERQIEKRSSSPRANPDVVGWLKSLKEAWTTCSRFLDYNILPRLVRLKPVLLSQDARDALGDDTVKPLIRLIDELPKSKAPVSESEFSRLVNRISEDPDTAISTEVWANYKANVDWYSEHLLRAREESRRPSRLIEFIFTAPRPLRSIVNSVYENLKQKHLLPENLRVSGIEGLSDQLVFCTETLLRDVVNEVFLNISSHLSNPRKPVDVCLNSESAQDGVIFTVSNDNSKTKEPAGQGLHRLDNRLKAFSGNIKPNPRPEDRRWTYSVDVFFLKGE
jgi:orotate phosphoribosyltransferase